MSAEDEGFSDVYQPPLDRVAAQVDRQSASVIQIDAGKHVTAVAICAAFCGVAVVGSIWAAYTARDAATEARLLQQHVMTLEAELKALRK